MRTSPSSDHPLWLIAADEAGYGPTLGPLVIVVTTWQIAPARTPLDEAFGPYRDPIAVGDHVIQIDDSKRVYRPWSRRVQASQGSIDAVGQHLMPLHRIAAAAAEICRHNATDFATWIDQIAPIDRDELKRRPWLRLTGDQPLRLDDDPAALPRHWSTAAARLVDVDARVITAAEFNRRCDQATNKADLLSESTIEAVLVARDRIVTRQPRSPADTAPLDIQAYCDRQGGRRRYAAIVQHHLARRDPDAVVAIDDETHRQSRYRIDQGDVQTRIAFTVSGDSFTPVAFSSLIAKYIRERYMASLNRYFASLHRGTLPLRRTAGYAVDAQRYLRDIAPILRRERIDTASLIRSR